MSTTSIDPFRLLKSDLSPADVNQILDSLSEELVAVPDKKHKNETAEMFEERQDAARQVGRTMLAAQLGEKAQMVLAENIVKLFQLGFQLYLKGVTAVDESLQVDTVLDLVAPNMINPSLRSRIRKVVTELIPAMAEAGEDIAVTAVHRMGLIDPEGVQNSTTLYAAAQGVARARELGKMDRDLAKEVADAIRSGETEAGIKQIFVDRGIVTVTQRVEVFALVKKTGDKSKLTYTVEIPEGLTTDQVADALEEYLAIGARAVGKGYTLKFTVAF